MQSAPYNRACVSTLMSPTFVHARSLIYAALLTACTDAQGAAAVPGIAPAASTSSMATSTAQPPPPPTAAGTGANTPAAAGGAGVNAAPVTATVTPVPSAGASASNMQSSAGASAQNAGTGAANHPAGHTLDDCLDASPVAIEDSKLSSMPGQWMSPTGQIELVLPDLVQKWMDDRLFKEGHDAWHAVRRCGFTRGGFGIQVSPAFDLCNKPELVAKEQECGGTGDGYQFLAVHRHMIKVLRDSFPTHQDLFAGFSTFPFDAKDVPEAWRGSFGTGWSAQIVQDAKLLEDIENNVERFPTEGELGMFIQCGEMMSGASGVHGALHFKWIVNGSPYQLGDSKANLGNYMFWKLHGWIDNIWTRYRTAKGLQESDPKHLQGLEAQCREMHQLGNMIGKATVATTPTQLPKEAGVFHEQVRPIFEKTCAGCHSGGNAEAGLVLGGQVSSAAVVSNLVKTKASRGGQFARVEPGQPQKSWLYLKASGTAVSAGCTGTCNNQVMPPTGMVTLSQAELGSIASWIEAGAVAPTQTP